MSNVNYGYCRCSTNEGKQDIKRQVKELTEAGVIEENIYLEYEHGQAKVKQALESLLEKVESGDTIYTTEVSRLTRSTKQLCELLEIIQQKRIRLVILGSITIDCRKGDIDPMTKAFLQMAGVFAEVEVEMTRARVKSGLANARAKGKVLGRPETTKDDIPPLFYKHYALYKNKQISKVEFSRLSGFSRPTIDKYIKLIETT